MDFEYYKGGKDVLLIFTGIGGTTKGFENKYETIAKQVMKDFRFSVLIVTTPSGSWLTLKENMELAMQFLFEKAKEKEFKIYAMGTSAGANIVLSFSYLYPHIKKVLAVNPVLNVNFHLIDRGIKAFTGEKINVVLGEKDESNRWVELLPKVDNLEISVLPQIDHQFSGNLDTFIALPEHYLFQ